MSETNEQTLQQLKDTLKSSLQEMLDLEEDNKLNIIILDCEMRLKRRVKPSSMLELYEKYFDVLYAMAKLDYQALGTEGELSRDVNGTKNTFSSIRPSDEVLSKIPLNIGVRK